MRTSLRRRVLRCLSSLLLCHLLAPLMAAEIDSDGDGVIDAEDPNPANSQIVPWRSLGSWRFTNGTLAGDDGQQPIGPSSANVVADGFQGSGARFGSGGVRPLVYRAVEASGRPNISATRGSLLLRLKPAWSAGAGPGAWATLLQTTNFALRISPNGSSLVLTSARGGSSVTNVQIKITPRANLWSYALMTYAPEETSLSFDAPSTRVTGPGLAPPADFNSPNHFLAIGSAVDGSGGFNGVLDEVVAFNAPGVLAVTSMPLSAVASNNPPGLNLVWVSPTNAITEIKRRRVDATVWEPTHAAFGTHFFDAAAVPGERYEYNVNTRVASVTTGQPDDIGQFIKASLQGTPLHHRGKLILLVDQTLAARLEPELGTFITNLAGDGWQILRADVPRHVDDYSAPQKFLTNYFHMTNVITPLIRSNYARFGAEIKYILAVGHVPVPYWGTLADDGHSVPGYHGLHTGAWSSDLFYGDIDGLWTDNANVATSSYPFNHNVPGDGRLDQNKIPENAAGVAQLEIATARIDFANLPSFTDSEATLLKKYFNKNADFRRGITTFAANAMAAEHTPNNSTTPIELATEMLSKASVLKRPALGDVFSDRGSYLFGLQSGPGAFDRINDAFPNYQHTSADVARGLTTTTCAFFYLRGSYFPDWNAPDNFLRAVLGSARGGLTVAPFIGLKNWRADGLGVGLSIGHEMADMASNWYFPGNAQSVRTAELLGDPTLRYPVLPPPGGVGWTVTKQAVTLRWAPSNGATGYYVYRSTDGVFGRFEPLTPTPLAGTDYVDETAPAKCTYMIRAAALATTGSGTFTNLSQGVFTHEISSADL